MQLGKFGLVLAFLMLCGWSAAPAAAQDTPRFEGFVGYSYLWDATPGSGSSVSFNGGNASIAYNPLRFLGVVADFGGYQGSAAFEDESLDFTISTFMFGPKFALRRGRLTPFAQTLFGVGHITARLEGGNFASQNDFSMTAGGGLDVRVARHLAIRAIQGEYLLLSGRDLDNNSLRISAGVVVRF